MQAQKNWLVMTALSVCLLVWLGTLMEPHCALQIRQGWEERIKREWEAVKINISDNAKECGLMVFLINCAVSINWHNHIWKQFGSIYRSWIFAYRITSTSTPKHISKNVQSNQTWKQPECLPPGNGYTAAHFPNGVLHSQRSTATVTYNIKQPW